VAKPLAKHKRKEPKHYKEHDHGWMVCGFDTSLSSIAGAAFAYDAVLRKFKGPVFKTVRWQKEDDYFSRLKDAVKSHEIVFDLMGLLTVNMEPDEIFIAQEEPWPMGIPMGKTSGFLKQQAEISGAFLGGLMKYRYTNVAQINNTRWRTMIANDLGITIHHSKWRSPELALRFNCRPADSGKFRSKEWALDHWNRLNEGNIFPGVIPDLPDIIERAQGKMPRPEGSTAKAVQPEDAYDALAVAWTYIGELVEMKVLPGLDNRPRV
jgi:hypothetical protein